MIRSKKSTRSVTDGEDRWSASSLHDSDALWLQRGQRLGSLLATRRFASRWAVALAVMGASILALTLSGLPGDGVTTTIHTEADRPI
jgi:hypothetical protein